MMVRPTFILDSATMDIADLRLRVALCLDSDSRRVLGSGISASTDDAMVAALCDAVSTIGVFPGVVRMDKAAEMPEVVRECWLMGAEIEHASLNAIIRSALESFGLPENLYPEALR